MNDMMISAVASGNELTKMYVTLIDTHCLGEVIPRPQASYIDKIIGPLRSIIKISILLYKQYVPLVTLLASVGGQETCIYERIYDQEA
jgi:hypothetical protein